MKKILVVDDEESIRWVLGKYLEKTGYSVRYGENGSQAIEKLTSDKFSAAILDIKMPDLTGIQVLCELRELEVDIPVIIITAQNTVKNAIDAMKQGAYDYIAKPFDLDEVGITVGRAVKSFENSKKLNILRGEIKEEEETQLRMVGKSPAMVGIYKTIGRVAERDITVLITGESGTGKELVARSIHSNSPRKDKELVAINIAAIPKDLLESELFGHERGAFTGAQDAKQGRFEEADGGTLHLDEIGDMPSELQTKLLRVLEEKQFYRLGSENPTTVDVRLIFSTNKNLAKQVEAGAFREDLYYRINAITIHIPPLRERKEDILPLTEYFLKKYGMELGEKRALSDEAKDTLIDYAWPGNVRELENTLKRVLVLSSDSVITSDTLLEAAPYLMDMGKAQSDPLDEVIKSKLIRLINTEGDSAPDKPYYAIIRSVEKPLIEETLRITDGNKKRAANILGINRNTLSKKMDDLGVGKDKD